MSSSMARSRICFQRCFAINTTTTQRKRIASHQSRQKNCFSFTPHPTTTRAFCLEEKDHACDAEKKKNNQQLAPPFQISILDSSHAVSTKENDVEPTQQEEAPFHTTKTVLSQVMDLFDFGTASQARKACRQGEILILRRIEDIKPTDSLVPRDTCYFLKENEKLDNIFQNRALVWAQPWVPIETKDVLLKVTRVDQDHSMYPVHQTGFVFPPTLDEPEWPKVVHQDEHMAVVDKPEHVTTIGVPRQDLQSMLPFLLAPPICTTTEYLPRPVHRLDRRTRGLVVVSKSKAAMSILSRAFEQRQVKKTYAALVRGQVQGEEGTIDYPIQDKPAVSKWKVLKRGQALTLLEIQPQTGRNHQIRRHLAYCLGTPIMGDDKYDQGPPWSVFRKHGLFLCSNTITLEHPMSGQQLSCSIPIPTKFEQFLEEQDELVLEMTLRQQQSSLDKSDIGRIEERESLEARVLRLRQEMGDIFATTEGTACVGEPSVDPSKLINPNQGDSEWINDF